MLARVFLFVTLITGGIHAHAATHPIAQVAGRISIDGVVDRDEWSGVAPIILPFETSPGNNVPAPVRTEAWVAYDSSTLYVAFRVWDPDIRSVRASISDRDASSADDYVGIVLDTFDDQRRAFEFYVNPFGVQMDRTYVDADAEADSSWDATWESAGRVFGDRWEVEMAIPFTALRFRATDHSQTWGFDLVRMYPRGQSTRIGLHPIDANRSCYVCQLAKLTGLTGIRPGNSVELVPTITASRTDDLDALTNARSGSVETSPGLTARWGVTPNVIVNGAVNPDFSHVESDAPQIDVNQPFTLSYPEKRPFFLEGIDFFRTPIAAVYTRTVADPSWGAKVTGKEGRSGGGAYVAADAVTGVIIPGADRSSRITIPGENVAAVVRYRYDLGSGSTLGLLMTSRRGQDYANDTAGVDGFFRIGAADTIAAQFLTSRTDYPDSVAQTFDQPDGSFGGIAGYARYQHETRNWSWTANYDNTATGFRADAGFVPQVDFRHADAGVRRTWWPTKHPFFARLWAGGEWDLAERQDGSLLEDEIEVYFGFAGSRQSNVQVVLGRRRRSFLTTEFAPEKTIDVGARMAPHKRIHAELEVNTGDTIDVVNVRLGRRLRIAPLIRILATPRLALDMNWDYERLNVEGGRLFTASAGELKAVYHLNLRTFIRVGGQYTDVRRNAALYDEPVPQRSRRLLPQLLFSYKLNPQTVLFAGYSSTRTGTDRRDILEQSRTFFLKIGYAWLV